VLWVKRKEEHDAFAETLREEASRCTLFESAHVIVFDQAEN